MRLFITLMTLGVLVASAHAQSAGPPTLTVGDTWKRSNGQEIKVVKAEDAGYTLTGAVAGCPACLGQFDKNLVLTGVTDADGKAVDVTRLRFVPVGPNWKFYDWPLELKKEWTITPAGVFQGNPESYTVTIVIKADEDVKTAAGVFKAHKMEQRWRIGVNNWVNVLWYSPDVKSAVKLTSNNPNTKEWELLSYSLK